MAVPFSMRRAFSVTALIAALFLHAALLLLIGRMGVADQPAVPLPIAIELLPQPTPEPNPPAQPATPPPTPAPTPVIPPKPKVPKPAPRPKPTRPTPVMKPVPETAEPVPAVTMPAPPVQDAAPTPAHPAPTAPPAATAVYISANYAARNRPPEYPALSRRYGEQGTVRLRVLVQADGTAGKVEIERSSGYALLDEAARNAVRSWRFQPATKDGKPVADWYLTPVVFKLEN